jgi:hypothetical protein
VFRVSSITFGRSFVTARPVIDDRCSLRDMGKLTKLEATAKLGAKETKRLEARGRDAVATVLKMKKVIESSFYEMGRALAVLKDPAVFRALRHTSFEQICDTTLGISESQAGRLIAITEHFGARDAKKLITSTRGTAIIDLAKAIGGKTTPKGLLSRGTVHLPGGKTIDVRAAEAHAIDAAAHDVRAHHAPSTHGGLVVSKDAKRFFERLNAALKKSKLDVRVDAIAASETVGAKMRIVAGVGDASKLAAALRAAARSGSREWSF